MLAPTARDLELYREVSILLQKAVEIHEPQNQEIPTRSLEVTTATPYKGTVGVFEGVVAG